MIGDFNDDLRENLLDPEFAAYYTNAQAESARELLKCGIITELNETSGSNKMVVWGDADDIRDLR